MNPRALHFGAEEVDLRTVQFTTELLACVPPELARRYQVLPVRSSPDKLCIAIADPSDIQAIDTLHHAIQRNLELCVAEASQLEEFVTQLYGSDAQGKR